VSAAATDQLGPQPLRDRAAAIAEQLTAVIDRHQQTRPSVSPSIPHPAERENHEPPTP
jgi:hypothetical protein